MLKSYLKKIAKIANQGDAREESYYSTLESLLKETAQSFDKQKFHITTLPKTTEAGNPDFRVGWKTASRFFTNIPQTTITVPTRSCT